MEEYEKDIVQRAGLTLNDIMFLEPEEMSGEVRHRISPERCAEIRGLLQLTSLKGITLPNARILLAAGVSTRWELLNMSADAIVDQVNAQTDKKWGDKESRKMEKVLADNADLLEDI